jgi:M6 family metalloprotease-like protein
MVVLIRFSDHKNVKVLPDPEEYDILFNHNGPTSNNTAPSGSVSDVFMANSYDSFVLETKVVPYWVDVDRTEETTVAGNYGLNLADTRKTWRMSLEMVEKRGFNFRQVDKDGDGVIDCLVLLHSGPAAETGGTDCETGKNDRGRIWSHATEQVSRWWC